MEYIKSESGQEFPMVGFGTFKMKDPEILEKMIDGAYKIGYRFFDTAWVYKNEGMIGNILENLKIRKNIALATKIWPKDFKKDDTKMSIERSLKDLKTDYLDVMYLHWPGDFSDQAWKVMEDYYEQGIIKNIAVSNFTEKHLEKLSLSANIKPMLDQIELHPYLQLNELVDYLKKNKIIPLAWSPLSRGNSSLLNDQVLEKIGKKYNKTSAQIALKFNIERGVIVIPKTNHIERAKENFDLFDFSLTEEEMDQIKKIDKNERSGGDPNDDEYLRNTQYSDRWKEV